MSVSPHEPAVGPGRSNARLIGGALALALVAAMTAWVVATDGAPSVDVRVHQWLAEHPSHTLHLIATWAKQPGTRAVYLGSVGAAAAAGLWARRSLRPVLLTAGVVGVETLVVFLFKVAIGRRAPRSGEITLWSAGTSFPAGHAANAVLGAGLLGWWVAWAAWARRAGSAALDVRAPAPSTAGSGTEATGGPRATTTAAAHRRAVRVCAVLAVLVGGITGASMTWLDYHWVTDTVAGWGIGAIALVTATWLDDRGWGHPSSGLVASTPDGGTEAQEP